MCTNAKYRPPKEGPRNSALHTRHNKVREYFSTPLSADAINLYDMTNPIDTLHKRAKTLTASALPH